MSAYAPYNANYGLTLTKPYLTVGEYNNAPTAIDTNNLIPGGDINAQQVALQEVIGRASSMIDAECLGAWGTLNATVDVENGRVWGNNQGQLIVRPKYWPILEVQSFQFGSTISNAASITPAGNVWIEPSQFIVQPTGIVGLGLNSPGGIGSGQYFCEWTYVNGFANTTLSASVAAGGQSLSLFDVTGIYPGSSLTIFDAPHDEQVTVASTYTPGSMPVPLAAPVVFEHDAGSVASNAPKALKQAAISLTTCLVKVRGSGALIAASIGEVTKTADSNPQGAAGDLDIAMRCIRQLRQIYVGY